MSPVTGLARLAGRSLPSSVHMGNFSPRNWRFSGRSINMKAAERR